ncbi:MULTISPECIES: hypothetical protein [unclassified Actinomyces]|uniref:hypothetical protein n=1 Tax=unclassified Actinomyces TaxID=2609248 RepID=UPI0013A6D1B3|nr:MULTISPECIES: hypothetical protein [unclassified Actinomyces]MBW3068358.1 hypothetical protein [Actinomyces sp. 594]NDR52820.1 hypothetical protein [Actinomyces sp. 565]
MRLLISEIYKLYTYRWPALLLAGALAVGALLDIYLALAYASSSGSYVSTALSFNELVCRLAWFTLPILVLAGDARDGMLASVVLVRPRPRAILAAKLVSSLVAAQVSALGSLVLIAAFMPLGGWPDAAAALAAFAPKAARMMVLPPLAVCFGFAVAVLANLRSLPWVATGLVLWSQVIEKLLFTVVGNLVPPSVGALLAPYSVAVTWFYGAWGEMGLPAFDTWGFLPLLVLAALTCAAAAVLLTRTADPAGRPWGLPTVALTTEAVATTTASARSTSAAAAPMRSAAADGAARSHPAGPPAPTTSARASRSGLLGDVLAWLRASMSSHGALRRTLLLTLLTGAANAAITAGVVVIFEISLTSSGALSDAESAIGAVVSGWGMLCLPLTLLTGSWTYLRLIQTRELALVYTALPRRSAVITACAVHAGLQAAVVTLVSIAAGLAVLAFATSVSAVLATAGLTRMLVAAPLGAVLAQLSVIGAAVLIRRPIPALAGVAGWLLLAEPLLQSSSPVVERVVGRRTIAALVNNFVSPSSFADDPLSTSAALMWLIALAAVLVTMAVVVERRRPGVIGN